METNDRDAVFKSFNQLYIASSNLCQQDDVDIVINEYTVDIGSMTIYADYNVSLYGAGFSLFVMYNANDDKIYVSPLDLKHFDTKGNTFYELKTTKLNKHFTNDEHYINKLKILNKDKLGNINEYIAETIKHLYNSTSTMMTDICHLIH